MQPPDIPPKLFVLPKDHELAPNVQLPQPRTDLEALVRLGIDQFCAALGEHATCTHTHTHSHYHPDLY